MLSKSKNERESMLNNFFLLLKNSLEGNEAKIPTFFFLSLLLKIYSTFGFKEYLLIICFKLHLCLAANVPNSEYLNIQFKVCFKSDILSAQQ